MKLQLEEMSVVGPYLSIADSMSSHCDVFGDCC